MMANMNVLLQELTEATERGTVPWEETVQEDTFLATLKSASLRIGLREEILTLEVRDIEGKLIEKAAADWIDDPVEPSEYPPVLVSVNPLGRKRPNPVASALKQLHLAARRRALNVDSKIESLLSELQAS